MRIAVATILLGRCLTAQAPASVSGTVIDEVTKQPLAGVDVALSSLASGGQMGPGFEPTIYGSLSKADGSFSVSGLPASTYMVNPKRNGYFAVHPETLSVTLKPGENMAGLTVSVIRSAGIVGRVTDQYGDPVQLAQVAAQSAGPGALAPLFSRCSAANTDDRGEFRLSCPPGRYFISAAPQRRQNPAEKRTDGSQAAVYSTTWYPGADSKERATAIEALPGRDTTGIEIRLVAHVSLSLSGIVTGASPGRPGTVRLWSAAGADPFVAVRDMRIVRVGKDGGFEFAGLAPGDYHLQGEALGDPAMRSGVTDVSIVSGNQGGVLLTLRTGEELNGVLEMSGGLGAGRPQINLQPVSPIGMATGQGAQAAVTAGGEFHLNPVFPGQYNIYVNPMPPGAYIKSVKLDNTEIGAGVLELARSIGSAKLKIVLSPNGATMNGSVVDEKGDPAQQALTVVMLARSADDAHPIGSGVVTAGVGYTLTGVGPGKYRLFAADPRTINGNLKALFERCEPIEIQEGERITKNAKMVALP
jgi:hypothetical protein